MDGAAGLADARSCFQKRDFPAGEATIVDEFVADGAPRPSTTEHRFVTVQTLLADFAMSRFNREQHRLPVPTGFSNTHGSGV